MKYSVIIPCAGSGKRMNLGYNKLLYRLDDETVIEKTVNIFKNEANCIQIILVVSKDDLEIISAMFSSDSKINIVIGGQERQDSVYNGLKEVVGEYVLIHDGARPYLQKSLILSLLKTLEKENACLLMVPAKDTIKIVKDGYVETTPIRDNIMHAQTPQAFKTSYLVDCYEKAIELGLSVTDDASIVEQLGGKVKVVLGDYSNIKITTMEDIGG